MGKSSIVLVWLMLPGRWSNQIVRNLFELINVKENGRSVAMSRCNCGRAREEAFNMLGFIRNYARSGFCNLTGRIR